MLIETKSTSFCNFYLFHLDNKFFFSNLNEPENDQLNR